MILEKLAVIFVKDYFQREWDHSTKRMNKQNMDSVTAWKLQTWMRL
jgi:hypothetical protein